MDKFVEHHGIAAPLIRINIDTDAIIPSREMKRVSKTGLADGLFANWRYLQQDARTPNPAFVLNQSTYVNASILLAGANFGCGSSREHAVWALKEYGFRVFIAPSFGAIFQINCFRNGLLPIEMEEASIDRLAASIAHDPQTCRLTIDLARQAVRLPDGQAISFEIAAIEKEMLIEGLDPIAVTLKLESSIDAFQHEDAQHRPWVYLNSA